MTALIATLTVPPAFTFPSAVPLSRAFPPPQGLVLAHLRFDLLQRSRFDTATAGS